MTDETQTTGTPDQDGGDAVEQTPTAGTPETDGRDAESDKVVISKDQWNVALKWKADAEEAKRLKAQLEEQQDDEVQPPDEPVAAPPKGSFEWFLANGDPVARRQAMFERKVELDAQLAEMPADERESVKAHWRKNHHRLGDMKAARAELNASKYEAEMQRLREENERLKRGPDPEVMHAPPTGGREVTARERKTKMTEAQFDDAAGHIRRTQGELAYMKYVRENAGNIG